MPTFPEWSHNLPQQVLNLTGVIAIAAGSAHSLAVQNDGTVWAWGDNTWGQLGNETTNDGVINGQTPADTATFTPVQVHTLTGVKAVSGGSDFSLALTTAGAVYAWGMNGATQLGRANTGLTFSSTALIITQLTNIAGISAGESHSLAINNALEIWAWGNGHLGTTSNPGKVNW